MNSPWATMAICLSGAVLVLLGTAADWPIVVGIGVGMWVAEVVQEIWLIAGEGGK